MTRHFGPVETRTAPLNIEARVLQQLMSAQATLPVSHEAAAAS